MRKKLRLTTAAAAVFIIAAVALFIHDRTKTDVLVLRDENTGKIYAKYDLDDGETFSVTFRHSVNKSDVEEIYCIKNGKLWLTGCRYYSFGAGVAEELDPDWTLSYDDDGAMILSDINMEMDHLVYIVGTVYDHILKINDEKIILNELCGKNSQVFFSAEKSPVKKLRSVNK